MAYTYGPPSRTVMVPPTHTHGGYGYSFWEQGTAYGGSGRFGRGRGLFGPPSMMGRGVPMRYTRFYTNDTSPVDNFELFPVVKTFVKAAKDYEALNIDHLKKVGENEYHLKRIPALKGVIKGIWHYMAEPAISVANSDKKTRLDYARQTGEMSESGYQFAILNGKTKNLKRGFKWGLEGEGYASHLVEKLGYLNSCYNADELDREQYEATVAKILEDLEDFRDMKAVSEKEYADTVETIKGQIIYSKGLAR